MSFGGTLDLKNTWLAVLSACNTGEGKAIAGEGVLGLRRGFVKAGAQNLLMTLWKAGDKTTARLMKDFYEQALESGDAPGALVEVQRKLLKKLRATYEDRFKDKKVGTALAALLAGPFAVGPICAHFALADGYRRRVDLLECFSRGDHVFSSVSGEN